jgi:hypothetical protein
LLLSHVKIEASAGSFRNPRILLFEFLLYHLPFGAGCLHFLEEAKGVNPILLGFLSKNLVESSHSLIP